MGMGMGMTQVADMGSQVDLEAGTSFEERAL
jgi:hypothetical protein